MSRILISAGEISGDRLAGALAQHLRRREPGLELFGMGGPAMEAAGVEILHPIAGVSVVGFTEVWRHLRALRQAGARLVEALRARRPDLAVFVDFPDFHLPLARRARHLGVPVVYYVSPQLWAWRRGRLRAVRRLVRRMLVLLPFEVEIYERAGVPVTFVGHPAVERIPARVDREAVRRRLGLEPNRATVALLPGSRPSELQRMLPVLLEAAGQLERSRTNLQWLLVRAPGLAELPLRQAVEAAGLPRCVLATGEDPEVLGAADAAAVASGTASLEAALSGVPAVVVYRLAPLSYLLGRMFVRVEHVALPNLVLGGRIFPELIQRRCVPEAVARELGALLEPARAAAIRAALAPLRERLSGKGANERAAEAVLAELAAVQASSPGADVC